jgi:hypothetical protein
VFADVCRVLDQRVLKPRWSSSPELRQRDRHTVAAMKADEELAAIPTWGSYRVNTG